MEYLKYVSTHCIICTYVRCNSAMFNNSMVFSPILQTSPLHPFAPRKNLRFHPRSYKNYPSKEKRRPGTSSLHGSLRARTQIKRGFGAQTRHGPEPACKNDPEGRYNNIKKEEKYVYCSMTILTGCKGGRKRPRLPVIKATRPL